MHRQLQTIGCQTDLGLLIYAHLFLQLRHYAIQNGGFGFWLAPLATRKGCVGVHFPFVFRWVVFDLRKAKGRGNGLPFGSVGRCQIGPTHLNRLIYQPLTVLYFLELRLNELLSFLLVEEGPVFLLTTAL